MMIRYLLSILCCLLSLVGYAQNQSHVTLLKMENTNQEILATVRRLADLMIKRDTAEMNKILDTHYTLTHITGYVQPKAEWFNEVAKESMKYYSAKEVSIDCTVGDNKANVTVQNLVDARIWGSRNTWRLQQKLELEKRNGNWIILKSVASIF